MLMYKAKQNNYSKLLLSVKINEFSTHNRRLKNWGITLNRACQ